jgi:uncharacterized membrane protein
MRYIRIFWILAVVLFIIPFLGIPQSFKDFLIMAIAFILGFLAWVRQNTIKRKRLALAQSAEVESEVTK